MFLNQQNIFKSAVSCTLPISPNRSHIRIGSTMKHRFQCCQIVAKFDRFLIQEKKYVTLETNSRKDKV